MHYVGFDLGTTNSSAAVFDGEQVVVVRSAQGGDLTPSVVRISGKGTISVGARARRHLDRDPANTHSEFKRLMGTNKRIEFAGSGLSRLPEELSAELLMELASAVEAQLGFRPTQAVVTVPALFELPQSRATSEAARLAGFTRTELLQEPIASALAAGWTTEDATGSWLVYDLGGGTFDVSLLESREGLLRVVGHDGDNFLGGRDFDRAIVDWAIETLAREEGLALDRSNPGHRDALRLLALAAEEAKVALTSADNTVFALAAPLQIDDVEVEVELELDRATLEARCVHLIDRSVAICERLLAEHGLVPSQLLQLVLVGGPSVMPVLRRRLAESLGAPIADTDDPMTLVARGAAIFAATAGLDAAATPPQPGLRTADTKVWLQHPTMCSDLHPQVVGRVIEGARPAEICFVRQADGLVGLPATPDEEGVFVADVALRLRTTSTFSLQAVDADGLPLVVEPATITIVHGLTISDPPLSRTIGIALSDGTTRTFFDRGTPLPARRTFVQHTARTLTPGDDTDALLIPVIQGEFEVARLCQVVGSLQIAARDLREPLSMGSPVEITLELDRSGCLTTRALLPGINRVFDGVAHLVVPDASPEVLVKAADSLAERLVSLRTSAFREGDRELVTQLQQFTTELDDACREIDSARGGDEDAGQRARRLMTDLDARIHEIESSHGWVELVEEALDAYMWAAGWVGEYGRDAEQMTLQRAHEGLNRAIANRSIRDLNRRKNRVRDLGWAAYIRDPDAWRNMFDRAAARADDARDLALASKLVRKGRKLVESGKYRSLEPIVRKLWKLLPDDAEEMRSSHGSGVR